MARIRGPEGEQTVSLLTLPDAVSGDVIVVHAGFALQRLDHEAAREALRLRGEPTPAAEEAEP